MVDYMQYAVAASADQLTSFDKNFQHLKNILTKVLTC